MASNPSALPPTRLSPSAAPARWGFGLRFAYFILVVGTVLLAGTGIGTFALGQAPMTHWVLMFHVGVSPLFALGLAMVAVASTRGAEARGSVAGALFWLMLLTGLIVVLSGVLPMTPIFGTEGQRLAYLIHRYAGIALAILFVLVFLSRCFYRPPASSLPARPPESLGSKTPVSAPPLDAR